MEILQFIENSSSFYSSILQSFYFKCSFHTRYHGKKYLKELVRIWKYRCPKMNSKTYRMLLNETDNAEKAHFYGFIFFRSYNRFLFV